MQNDAQLGKKHIKRDKKQHEKIRIASYLQDAFYFFTLFFKIYFLFNCKYQYNIRGFLFEGSNLR